MGLDLLDRIEKSFLPQPNAEGLYDHLTYSTLKIENFISKI